MPMDILEKSLGFQNKVIERTKRIGKGKYGRGLKMSRKPDSEEFIKTVQVTTMGMILIGGLGFVIYLVFEYTPDLIDWILGG